MNNCLICMVHFAADACCGVGCFPYWHAVFQHHMADQHRKSVLTSLNLPGSHNAANPIWFEWKLQAHPTLNDWFERVWEMLLAKG